MTNNTNAVFKVSFLKDKLINVAEEKDIRIISFPISQEKIENNRLTISNKNTTEPQKKPITPDKIIDIEETQESQTLYLKTMVELENENWITGKKQIYPIEQTGNERLRVLNQWEGTVLDIDTENNTFFAELVDLTLDNKPEETAHFSFNEIENKDKPLLEVGASFFWTISNKTESWGQTVTIESIQFRRFGIWSKKQIDNARKEGEDLANYFSKLDDR